LRFTVVHTLDGDSASAKESLIGIHVFGRQADYNPATDPIVRVEARRLRRKLSSYYLGDGRCDPVRIDVPKGGYVPVFAAQRAHDDIHIPLRSVAVLPFADRSDGHELDALADGLTVRLITTLAGEDGLRVVSSTSVFQYKNRAGDARQIGAELDAGLIVEGSLRVDNRRYRCDVQLISTADGMHRWAGSFDSGECDRFEVEDQFADRIAEGVRAATMAA
jgi:serine/threonine-protein kinase